MKLVCEKNMCAGCMACIDICPKNAIQIVDTLSEFNAVIDEKRCVNCGMCEKICQQQKVRELKKPIFWKQGWSLNEDDKLNGSSGGIATTLQRDFFLSGGLVYSCMLDDGQFIYKKINSEKDFDKTRGSKYVKSNPKGVYKAINNDLKIGKRVLFLGLPCQVASLLNYVENNINRYNLFTIDLICHGTPSSKLLDVFLEQYNIKINEANKIDFREKGKFYIKTSKRRIVPKSVRDFYSISFLNGITYTKNCYYCKYANSKRVADITLGDSWGSELSKEITEKGVSLVLCQSEKGKQLLESEHFHLENVNEKRAIEFNSQLRSPCLIKKERGIFFKNLKEKKII